MRKQNEQLIATRHRTTNLSPPKEKTKPGLKKELKNTAKRHETRYLKSWNVSGASTMIWSIENLLNQNLTLGLFRLNTSRPSYSQSNLFCSKWAKELARLRSRPF